MASVYQRAGRDGWYMCYRDPGGRFLSRKITAQTEAEALRFKLEIEEKVEGRVGVARARRTRRLIARAERTPCPAAALDVLSHPRVRGGLPGRLDELVRRRPAPELPSVATAVS
jgi:hypothetical protein